MIEQTIVYSGYPHRLLLAVVISYPAGPARFRRAWLAMACIALPLKSGSRRPAETTPRLNPPLTPRENVAARPAGAAGRARHRGPQGEESLVPVHGLIAELEPGHVERAVGGARRRSSTRGVRWARPPSLIAITMSPREWPVTEILTATSASSREGSCRRRCGCSRTMSAKCR